MEYRLSNQQEPLVKFLRSALRGMEPYISDCLLLGNRRLEVPTLGLLLRGHRHQFDLNLHGPATDRLQVHSAFSLGRRSGINRRLQTAALGHRLTCAQMAVLASDVPKKDLLEGVEGGRNLRMRSVHLAIAR